MTRVRVWYDSRCDQIFISGEMHSYAPRSLDCRINGGGSVILIHLAGSPDAAVAGGQFSDFGGEDGAPFATPEATKAYLDAVFSQQKPGGDRIRVPVDIASSGQSVIPIQDPPILLSSVRLIVNGLEYGAPDIVASPVSVTWQNPDFPLDVADRVTLAYS
jgi:hypothetical protein